MKYDLFISYARRDGTPLARKLAEKLRETGLRVFWDQDSIPAGTNWDQQLDEALEQAEQILVILTPHSVTSEEVTAEWRPMLSRGKNVIPLLYVNCEIPRRLTMRQYVDFQEESRYPAALTELIEAVNAFKPQAVQLELSGAELMDRAQAYFESGQLELAARDYLHVLKDSEPTLRTRAARFLGKSRVASVFPQVIQATLEEENPSVKVELLITIARYAELTEWRSSAPNLVDQVKLFLQSDNPEVRKQAVRIYAYGQATETVPLIVELLQHDPSPAVKTQSALALGRLKTSESLQGLLAALNEPDENTRLAVVQALGVHGNPEVINHLRTVASRDRSAQVRKTANDVIAELKQIK